MIRSRNDEGARAALLDDGRIEPKARRGDDRLWPKRDGHLQGVKLIPMAGVTARWHDWPRRLANAVMTKSAYRSAWHKAFIEIEVRGRTSTGTACSRQKGWHYRVLRRTVEECEPSFGFVKGTWERNQQRRG